MCVCVYEYAYSIFSRNDPKLEMSCILVPQIKESESHSVMSDYL